jgi:hypothetical protein
MKRPFPLLALLAAGLATIAVPATARAADDKAACFDGATQGQTLRDQHKLVEARAQFTICARQTCPKQISKDCQSWLEQVDQAMPTIVVSAKDGAGRDLFDVTVTMDDHPFATKLMGEAVPVNPGVHVLHFEGKDGGRLDKQVLVREGVKNQNVDVVVGAPPVAQTPAIPTTGAGAPSGDAGPGGAGAHAAGETPAASSGGGPWKAIGFVAGGLGIAGLAVGAGFGFKAMGDKNDAQCDASSACKSGPLGNARNDAMIANIGFVAGGVLLAGGAALILFAPHGHAAETSAGAAPRLAGVQVAPAVGARDAGLLLRGVW